MLWLERKDIVSTVLNMKCLGNVELLEHRENPCNLEQAAGSWKLRTWCYCCWLLPLWTWESELGVSILVSWGRRVSMWMLLSQTLHTRVSEHLLSYFYPFLMTSQTPSQPFLRKQLKGTMQSPMKIRHTTCPNQTKCDIIISEIKWNFHIRCYQVTRHNKLIYTSHPSRKAHGLCKRTAALHLQ